MTTISNLGALIVDMDGVLWHGNKALPGLQEFFTTLRNQRLPFVLATNNASQTPAQYIDKLANFGIDADEDEIITSGIATANYLAATQTPSSRIFVIGESGINQPLLDRGFHLSGLDDTSTDIVVCGLDKSLTWQKLAAAALHIQSGATFIATNGDTTLPTERGFVPGNGATLAALKAATGAQPTIIGKPESHMYRQAIERLGALPEETIAIGDRLDTDILGAIRTGIRSIMVLSGISTAQDVASSDFQPTWIMQDLRDITQALNNRK